MVTAEVKTEDKLTTEVNRLFPVFLKLDQLNTLIIGGGSIGLEKLSSILNNSPSALVTLVAPEIKEEIFDFARYSRIRIIQRNYLSEDLNGKDLVIIATNNRELNKSIKEETKGKRILTNVADTPDLCDFYLSSVVQKGSIKLAISTNGKSPTIAKRLKEILDKVIPDEMENVLDNLVKIRSRLNGNFSEKVKELNKITSILVDNPAAAKRRRSGFITIYIAAVVVFLVAAYLLFFI